VRAGLPEFRPTWPTLAKTDQALELFQNHPEFSTLRSEIVSAQARIRRDAQIAALNDKVE